MKNAGADAPVSAMAVLKDPMRIKAILFDIDGTLVDSNDYHVIAWDDAFRKAGHSFDRQTIHDQIGKGADMLVPALLPHADEEAQQSLGKVQGEFFAKRFLKNVQPFPRARDLLVRAKQNGQKVLLASSASKQEVDHYVGLLDARDLVDHSTSSDDVENTKPAPDIFAVALKKLGSIDRSEAMVVGDTPYDVQAAGKCGIASIALRSGKFSDQALRDAGAVAIYQNAAALLDDYDHSPLGEPR